MIGNKKGEVRVCTVPLHAIRKSLTPSENRLTEILKFKKTEVRPGIQTRPALTACHRFTSCATTAAGCCITIMSLALRVLQCMEKHSWD